jgi:16S rRNA (cytosine1402-N4)-methyltransferase
MVDATLGEGGHSLAFLSRFPSLKIIGIDADAEILAVARERLKDFSGRIRFFSLWAQDFFAAPPPGFEKPDLVLIDLGTSVHHYKKSGRGFSFSRDEELDMRIDPSRGESAAELLKRLNEKELADLIYQNAGERYSRRIARAIVYERGRGGIGRSAALADIVSRAVPAPYRRLAFHPATRTFQAIRIAVNGELERLPSLLEGALKTLKTGGRMGVITFHSAEDRIVKNFFRNKSRDCTGSPDTPIGKEGHRVVNLLTRKAVGPGAEEVRANPPSRSAKLRVVEKIFDEELAS